MKAISIMMKYSATCLMLMAITAFAFLTTSCSDSKSKSKMQCQLSVYETYTNSEIEQDFIKMFEAANSAGDTATIQIYSEDFAGTPIIYHTEGDTAIVNDIIHKYGTDYLPKDLKLVWNKRLEPGIDSDSVEVFYLIALKGEPKMTEESVANVELVKNPEYGNQLSVKLSEEGAHQWEQVTEQNVGRAVAIFCQDKLLSYPLVNAQITGGRFDIPLDPTDKEIQRMVEELTK